MNIRTATLEDIDAIIKLGNFVDEFQVSDEVVTFWPKSVLVNCIQNKQNPILVAEDNGQIIGFVICNCNSDFKKATIENIFVLPEYRNKNIGSLLLENLFTELEKLNYEYVCLLVESKNNIAEKFYLKNNFNRGIDCVWLDKILGSSFKGRS